MDYAGVIATNGAQLDDQTSYPLLPGVAAMTRALLADVGGTNVRFAIADSATPEPFDRVSIRRYRVEKFPTFADAARQYLIDIGVDSVDDDLADRGYVAAGDASDNPGARPTHAVCAFAGPVMGDEVRMTNHAWTISMTELQRQLGFEQVRAINDFVAMAYSIVLLDDSDVQSIGDIDLPRFGSKSKQTFVAVGPGTGLGVSALLLRDGAISALATEAGHVGFAPTSAEQQEVLRRLTARFGRVSNERLLCGPGLVNVHAVLAEISDSTVESLTPEQITHRATDGSCAICIRAVETFCEMLGAVAGDMALAYAGWDGVYLAGGLTPALLPWLRRGKFRRHFEDKGRYSHVVSAVPTFVICHDEPGLLGAAACALIDAGVDLTQKRA
ncbi:MAG: glucokinase [Dokdonella sp.]